jgi:hypothetical protein
MVVEWCVVDHVLLVDHSLGLLKCTAGDFSVVHSVVVEMRYLSKAWPRL